LFEQQPGIAVCVHVFVLRLHVSVVQKLPSRHCELAVQQPGIGVDVHVFVVGSQLSLVQMLPSLQSVFVLQQPVIGVFTHIPVELQTSIVHALLSLHCALLVHDVAACSASPRGSGD
jgi:hypothetical protein